MEVWQEALEAVVALTRHERYRYLCTEHDDAAAYRDRVVALAWQFTSDPRFSRPESPPAPDPAPATPPELPGLARMAANLAGAVVRHVAAGMPESPDDVYDERLKACGACPRLRLPDWRCGGEDGCGCYLKKKARWADRSCPLGKWTR